MNTELFIAKRLVTDKTGSGHLTRSIINIAIVAIAISLSVMILSVAIVTGFKKEIRSKVIGFGSHIQIVNFDANFSYETVSVNKNQSFLKQLNSLDEVRHIQTFATKPGILKTKDEIQVAVLKGVDKDFDWSFFKNNIIEGSAFSINDSVISKKIIISEKMALLLKLKPGDKVIMYFVQKPLRLRKFTISGIYKTSVEEFDKLFILADIRQIQKLNNWDSNMVSGFEIFINDFNKIDETASKIQDIVGYNYSAGSEQLKIVSIRDKYPQIFDWLELQNINVWIILVLMTLVAGFNIISGLLILILERTNMIGVLKGVGSSNRSIRKIFLYQSLFITGRGLFWGNIIGLFICFVQYKYGIFKLNPETYYINTVPINFNWLYFLLLNVGTIFTTYLMLILPSFLITRISPSEAIKFN